MPSTLLILALLTALALLPLGVVLLRPGVLKGRREAALRLHRAQLSELEREAAEGRIGPAEHEAARLEVQRRLLAEADAAEAVPETPSPSSGRLPLLAAVLLVPVGAALLYAVAGHPELPAAPLAARMAEAERSAREADMLIATLRQRIAQLDPKSDVARQGQVLLGNAEAGREHYREAVAAWKAALAIRFDATLAAQTAELQARLDGRVGRDSADLFRRALADAPPDAPWRRLAEARLREAGQD